MSIRRMLKLIHFASTSWFVFSFGYILVLALRQAGMHWWVVFSLSGYSAVVLLLVISIYLFAVVRGTVRGQEPEVEHPLSSTLGYSFLYSLAPFLGGLAGFLGTLGVGAGEQFFLGIAMGTLGGTFLLLIIVDPLVGVVEMLLPASQAHRQERLLRVKLLREEQQTQRKRLLMDLEAQERDDHVRWRKNLQAHAERLSELLVTHRTDSKKAQIAAVDIGVEAWQMGGLACMRELRGMAMDICRAKYPGTTVIDSISIWWDGVGGWHNTTMEEKGALVG